MSIDFTNVKRSRAEQYTQRNGGKLLRRFSYIDRDCKFGIQMRLDWPQMGQIWDFLRFDFYSFWLTKSFYKKSQIYPI